MSSAGPGNRGRTFYQQMQRLQVQRGHASVACCNVYKAVRITGFMDFVHITRKHNQILLPVGMLLSCFCGAPSLTRERVCNLQSNHLMVRVAQNP
jgi:hypothetical protein